MPSIIVHEAPVPKARPRLGKSGHVFTPRKTELAEERIAAAWREVHGATLFSGPLELVVEVRVLRPKGHYGRRGLLPSAPPWPAGRPDWDNYAKTASDALNGVAYRDDSQIISAKVTKLYATEEASWMIGVYEMAADGANGVLE